jgi:hypothetical protein
MVWLQWIAEVVGPLLLLALIIWAVVRTRTSSKGVTRAEEGARELREELAREDENRL